MIDHAPPKTNMEPETAIRWIPGRADFFWNQPFPGSMLHFTTFQWSICIPVLFYSAAYVYRRSKGAGRCQCLARPRQRGRSNVGHRCPVHTPMLLSRGTSASSDDKASIGWAWNTSGEDSNIYAHPYPKIHIVMYRIDQHGWDPSRMHHITIINHVCIICVYLLIRSVLYGMTYIFFSIITSEACSVLSSCVLETFPPTLSLTMGTAWVFEFQYMFDARLVQHKLKQVCRWRAGCI